MTEASVVLHEPSTGEPSAALRRQRLRCFFLATRPAFLTATLAAVAIGLASAYAEGGDVEPLSAAVTLLFALVAHGAANVINDYHDALNGTDDANQARIFPFTGGSRFIQNGVLSARAMALFGYGLMAAVVPAGLWLTAQSGAGLILIGLAGMLLAWAYSAPPLHLAARGLGEWAVAGSWWLVAVGSAYVQQGAFLPLAGWAGLGYGCLVANLLFINQFPDRVADGLAGKATLVVRLGPRRARWGYGMLASMGYGAVLGAVWLGTLPWPCLFALAPAVLSWRAARLLWCHAEQPSLLAPAIRMTIAAALAHGGLLALALVFSKGMIS